jgi:hypothetical protein
LKSSTAQNEKGFKNCEEIESGCSEANGNENEDEMDNLFKLSVLFVRGNPFDSLKHWRMRCRFLDANLRIGSLGRIREVDEEFLSISEQENGFSSRPLSRRGVRLIQVQPRENEILQEAVEADDARSSELPKKCCIEEHCKDSSNDLCGFSYDSETIIGNYSFWEADGRNVETMTIIASKSNPIFLFLRPIYTTQLFPKTVACNLLTT